MNNILKNENNNPYHSDNIDHLKKLFKEKNNILFLCHHNADPDAIGGALGLKYLANSFNKNKNPNIIISTNSVSKLTRNILLELNESVEIVNYPKLLDIVCFVDTASLNQVMIDENKLLDKNIILIDHHKKTDLVNICDLVIVDENSTSVCEIVANIFKKINIYPPKNIRTALLCGIVYDTKHLKLATEGTFNIISWLIKDISFQKILYLLTQESDESKKLAHLKACSRMELHTIKQGNQKYIVALSNSSSNEASCAKTMVSIGADIAFVVAVRKKDKEIRVSARCRKQISKQVHLGVLMEKIAKKLNGRGGGHAEAAGLNANFEKGAPKDETIKKVLNLCLNSFEKELIKK
ncbi:DHH family phosphoesterase [Methanococcus aeolicus]|uniref:DHH family phosphoesterase n=1 Tax=Methanococcus aeolicus TaxID=42879 RepID=UPI0021CAA782|nr:DHHA1 domain-containing protein [Methanococcus aeolicus]UXM84238.1 DHHA1 domain-containing protein [Methanococcus aeolicus]